jgi:tellurite resistance protein
VAVDAELIQRLESIGLTVSTSRLVALLPLVQVAWADGSIQAEERKLILDIAKKRGFADEAGMPVLEKWLTTEPSKFVYSTGRKLVNALVSRYKLEMPNLEKGTIEEVVAYCSGVAEAAGGVFGFAKVAAAEKQVIAEIAEALNVKNPKSWAEVKGGVDR